MKTTKRWKPKEGEEFYVIDSCNNFLISRIEYCGEKAEYTPDCYECNSYIKSGNYFKTEKSATEMAKKIKKLLREK